MMYGVIRTPYYHLGFCGARPAHSQITSSVRRGRGRGALGLARRESRGMLSQFHWPMGCSPGPFVRGTAASCGAPTAFLGSNWGCVTCGGLESANQKSPQPQLHMQKERAFC